ncbi:hypothetical protein AB0C96_18140 [Streptomyces sp. NPDC048506]|uniref:hypothetical protein n=1 Tax=Streptomyces sp. NPDC048506 TaxID=3155028 RepID=UPI00342ECBA4
MRSPHLALCAAVVACAVTTAPAYGTDGRGAVTGTVFVTPAAAERVTGDVRMRPDGAPPDGAPPGAFASAGEASFGDVPAPLDPATHAAGHRELSSTSAVGLVLVGGAVLVVAGQLLRLRLRLRRERQGEDEEG